MKRNKFKNMSDAKAGLLSQIVAMGERREIGQDNALPWHLPADLKHFKATTMGKPIIMGRRTYEAIGKPLPGRTNIVVTRNPDYEAPGCIVARSLDAALEAAGDVYEAIVIGGAGLYREALPATGRIYLTEVHSPFEADTYYPDFQTDAWREIGREDHTADEQNPYPYSFVILERTGSG